MFYYKNFAVYLVLLKWNFQCDQYEHHLLIYIFIIFRLLYSKFSKNLILYHCIVFYYLYCAGFVDVLDVHGNQVKIYKTHWIFMQHFVCLNANLFCQYWSSQSVKRVFLQKWRHLPRSAGDGGGARRGGADPGRGVRVAGGHRLWHAEHHAAHPGPGAGDDQAQVASGRCWGWSSWSPKFQAVAAARGDLLAAPQAVGRLPALRPAALPHPLPPPLWAGVRQLPLRRRPPSRVKHANI